MNIKSFSKFFEKNDDKWIKDAIKNPGSLRKSLDKEEDEKITKKEIESELKKLTKKDKDKEKPGIQLNKKDATKKRRLELAKTLSSLRENDSTQNYMFFNNLETVKRMVDELLSMNEREIDDILKEHDWASDHISTSKDDIEEVFNFLSSKNHQ